ncbi:hypothetical protein FIE12Z_11494 [Fusarium flagelliforme]|uniref:Uncharacterized protein n=2 Tax=Fusarium flagelliforme TaxID=2675880 RepID=A0A395M8K7_9HYPO|nr:hypothetical protein FIE12Z_11494 [Fusarium flagelliforme]
MTHLNITTPGPDKGHLAFTRDSAAGFMLGAVGGIVAFVLSYLAVCFTVSNLRARRQRQREERELMELIEMMELSDVDPDSP